MSGLLALSLLASSPAAADATPLEGATPVANSGGKKKIPLLAAGLNWFIPGAGYLYNGEKPVYVSLPMIAGAAGLTYVEQIHTFEGGGNLQATDPMAFNIMFASVLAINTGVAIDAYREAKAINEGRTASLSVAPRVAWTDEGEPAVGLTPVSYTHLTLPTKCWV